MGTILKKYDNIFTRQSDAMSDECRLIKLENEALRRELAQRKQQVQIARGITKRITYLIDHRFS
jgi:hypothetical protein